MSAFLAKKCLFIKMPMTTKSHRAVHCVLWADWVVYNGIRRLSE